MYIIFLLAILAFDQAYECRTGIYPQNEAILSNPSKIQKVLVLFDQFYKNSYENYYEFVEHWLDLHKIRWEKFNLELYNITEEALESYDGIVIPVISGPESHNIIARFLDDNEWEILTNYPVYIPYAKNWVPTNPHFKVGETAEWGIKGGDLLLGQMVRELGFVTVPTYFGFDIDDLVRSGSPRVSIENLQHLVDMMKRHGVTAFAGIRILDLNSEEVEYLIANQDVLIPTLHQHKEGQLGGDLSYKKQLERWTELIDEMQDAGFNIDYQANGYCIPPNLAYNDDTLRMLAKFDVKYIAVDHKETRYAQLLSDGIIGLPRSMFHRMDSKKDNREDILKAFAKKYHETDWKGYKEYVLNDYLRESIRKSKQRVYFCHDSNIVNDEPAIDILDHFFSYFEERGNAIFVNSVELGDHITSQFRIINVTRTQRDVMVYVNGDSDGRVLFVPDDPTTGYRMTYGDINIYHVDKEQMVDYQIEKATDYGVYVKLLEPKQGTPHFFERSGDIVCSEGAVNQFITWNAWDPHPSRYKILQNDYIVASGSWDNSPITIRIDNLSCGSYSFVCIVMDSYGNSAREVIHVSVIYPGKAPIRYQTGFHGNS